MDRVNIEKHASGYYVEYDYCPMDGAKFQGPFMTRREALSWLYEFLGL